MSQVAAGPTSCIPLPAAKIRPSTSVCRSRPATAMAQGPCKTSHPFRRPKKTKRTLMDAAKLVQNPNLPARQLSNGNLAMVTMIPTSLAHIHTYSYQIPSNTLPMEGPNMLKQSSNVSHRQPILKRPEHLKFFESETQNAANQNCSQRVSQNQLGSITCCYEPPCCRSDDSSTHIGGLQPASHVPKGHRIKGKFGFWGHEIRR